LRLGTSSWSSQDWVGVFYPPATAPADFISEYAKHFDTVEVDSTFYRAPSPAMVRNWAARTPSGFLVAAKFPQVITHEKVLLDCSSELSEFLTTMDLLGDKLGPLVLQFPYFDESRIPDQRHFLSVLEPFLAKLPAGYKFAVEIRNREWLNARFTDVLRKHNIALVLQDLSSMPRPWEFTAKFDPVTADFAYVRWLGDRLRALSASLKADVAKKRKRIEQSTQNLGQAGPRPPRRSRQLDRAVPPSFVKGFEGVCVCQ
jgi:uncharacterized protein YecE (DUF72 family)